MIIATSVSSGIVVLVGAVFLTCSVEMVEALTIVFAVGHTRGWRSAFEGSAVALLVLAALVAAFGPALVSIPLNASTRRRWRLAHLRHAVAPKVHSSRERPQGKHDEDAIYEAKVANLRAAGDAHGRDRVAFVMAFKGVFLEGLEVVDPGA